MPTVFQIHQISADDVSRHNLEANDEGRYVFVLHGCLMGFTTTREEAENLVARLEDRRQPRWVEPLLDFDF